MDNVELSSNGVPDDAMFEELFKKHNALSVLSQDLDADIFVVSGMMERSLADRVLSKLQTVREKKPNCIVFLCTFGGNPDAAYIIARAFKNHYAHFSVYISGYCKSAGTLLVLGADEIVMSEKGELGPLDVQLRRDDALADFFSGLDIASSINKLGNEAFTIFEDTFLRIIGRSDGSITTKTAADIAVQLSTGIISPLAAQLDVFKFVESARSMDIAVHYGVRLGADFDIVYHLATHYPSHGFVIDFQEVSQLFPNTRQYDEIEQMAELQIQYMLKKSEGYECIRVPHENSIVVLLELDTETDESVDTDEYTATEKQGTEVHDTHDESQNDKNGK